MGKTENAENAMAQSALKRDTTLATGRLGPEGPWILRPFGDDFPYENHDASEVATWGRYNLSRYDRICWHLGKLYQIIGIH